MNKKIAFTLIELLVVIAIIGILSGLIVVSMSGITQKATIAKAQVFSNSLRNSLMLNIVGEWKMDEGTGQTVADSWGGVNNGTLGSTVGVDVNDPTWTTLGCVYGNCLSFDGTDDYFSVPDNTNLNSTELTVEVWVKSTKNSSSLQQGIIAKANIGGSEYGWILRKYTNDKFEFATGSGNPRNDHSTYSDVAYTDSNWHQVVGARTSTGVNYIYIDGARQIASRTGSSITVTSQPIVVGTVYGDLPLNTVYQERFSGLIDNIRMYNVAIPTSQIQEQYYVGLNSLLANRKITLEEYQSRLKEFNNSFAYSK